MVYPNSELKVKNAIKKALAKSVSEETGVGFNVLFDKVRKDGVTLRTFTKYLRHLIDDGVVVRQPDPRHKKGVTLFLRKDLAEVDRVLLELRTNLEKVQKMTFASLPRPKIVAMDRQEWEAAGRPVQEYPPKKDMQQYKAHINQYRKIAEILRLAYKAFFQINETRDEYYVGFFDHTPDVQLIERKKVLELISTVKAYEQHKVEA